MCYHHIHSVSCVAEKSKESYTNFEQWKLCYWCSMKWADMLCFWKKLHLGDLSCFSTHLIFYPNPGFHEHIINICQINFYMSNTAFSITQIEVTAFRSTICLPQRLFSLWFSLGNIRKGSLPIFMVSLWGMWTTMKGSLVQQFLQ